jgi:hypothetical protein
MATGTGGNHPVTGGSENRESAPFAGKGRSPDFPPQSHMARLYWLYD